MTVKLRVALANAEARVVLMPMRRLGLYYRICLDHYSRVFLLCQRIVFVASASTVHQGQSQAAPYLYVQNILLITSEVIKKVN